MADIIGKASINITHQGKLIIPKNQQIVVKELKTVGMTTMVKVGFRDRNGNACMYGFTDIKLFEF